MSRTYKTENGNEYKSIFELSQSGESEDKKVTCLMEYRGKLLEDVIITTVGELVGKLIKKA